MEESARSHSPGRVPHLSVSNFGPIAEAKLSLRPLSIFVGPSNSGKSYLAILLYAMFRYFGSRGHRFPRPFTDVIQSRFHPDSPEAGRLQEALVEWDGVRFGDFPDAPEMPTDFQVPAKLASILREIYESADHSALASEITRCFGLEAEALRRRGVDVDAKICFRSVPNGSADSVEHHLSLGMNEPAFQTRLPSQMPIRPRHMKDYQWREWQIRVRTSWSDQSDIFPEAWLFLDNLAHVMAPEVYAPWGTQAYYLPADRTGIMHAHRAVVAAVLDNAAMAGIRPSRLQPMLSGITADFLEQLIQLDARPYFRRSRYPNAKIEEICADIQEQVLDGEVSIENSDVLNYPEFRYQPAGWNKPLPLKNASSMVSELAPVVLYLRHLVRPGDTLIIEEPESHLHPSKQVQLTRQLASIIKAGVKVVITTHSEWVLEAVANLVRLSALPESIRRTFKDGEYALKREKVGAWLFKPGSSPGGSRVAPLELDESGVYPAEFDNVATEMYNEWARISRELENEK